MLPNGVTITVERDTPGGRDKYGDPIAGTVATHTIAGCGVAPTSPTDRELHQRGRDGIIIEAVLLAPAGADIAARDRVVVPDGAPMPGRYEVDGRPEQWVSPYTGWAAGTRVLLQRVEG